MTRPLPTVIAAVQQASERMADRHTPFVMNDWYVAAFAEEIKDQLLARTLLGRRLVFVSYTHPTPPPNREVTSLGCSVY